MELGALLGVCRVGVSRVVGVAAPAEGLPFGRRQNLSDGTAAKSSMLGDRVGFGLYNLTSRLSRFPSYNKLTSTLSVAHIRSRKIN
jgi:hypothetical protein